MKYSNTKPLGPDDPMPWGKHKGTPMREILEHDPGYLIWLTEQEWIVKWLAVYGYLQSIEDELSAVDEDRTERNTEGYDDFEDYRASWR